MADGIRLDTSDINRIVTVLNIVPEKRRYQVQRLLQASADRILKQAVDEVPLFTGALSDSGHVAPYVEDADHIAFDVTFGDGSSTPVTYDYGDDRLATGYAWFVELGTTKMEPRPYLGPAFEEESQKLVQRLGNLFQTEDVPPPPPPPPAP